MAAPSLDLSEFGGAAPQLDLSEFQQPKKAVGALSYIGQQAKAGLTADLPTIAGKALQYAGANDAGARLRAYGEANAEQAQPDESQGAIAKLAAGAIRGAAPIVPLAVGGLAANVLAPQLAVPLELGGAAALAGGFGGAQAQDTLEKAKAAGLSDEQATSAARKTGLITGVGMGAVGALTGGMAAPAIRAIASPVAKTAAESLAQTAAPTFTRPFLADTAGHLVGNVASMAAANAGTAAVEQQAGLPGPTPGRAALEGLESGAGLTAALLPFGAARTALATRANAAAVARLQNPNTDPQQRADIAARIHANINALDPQAANHFAENVSQSIDLKQPIDLGEHLLKPFEAPTVAKPEATPPEAPDLTTSPGAGVPPAPNAVDFTREVDTAGLSLAPSQKMGIDPSAGPISRAAAIAVDSGAHETALAQAAAAAKENTDESTKTAPAKPGLQSEAAAPAGGGAVERTAQDAGVPGANSVDTGAVSGANGTSDSRDAALSVHATRPAEPALTEPNRGNGQGENQPVAGGGAARVEPAVDRAQPKAVPASEVGAQGGAEPVRPAAAEVANKLPVGKPTPHEEAASQHTAKLQDNELDAVHTLADQLPEPNPKSQIPVRSALRQIGFTEPEIKDAFDATKGTAAPPENGARAGGAEQATQGKAQGNADLGKGEAQAKPLSVGITPNQTEPIAVKGGIVHIGKNEALNFDTGEPIKVAAGASEADIRKALKDGGALSKRQKFFGGAIEPKTSADAKQELADAKQGIGTAPKKNVIAEAKAKRDAALAEAPAKPAHEMSEAEFGAVKQAEAIADAEKELAAAKSGGIKIGAFTGFKSKAEAIRSLTAQLEKTRTAKPETFAGDHLAEINKAIREGKTPSAENMARYQIAAAEIAPAATHNEQGKPAGPATAPVVAESLKKAAASEERTPAQMKADLLGEIDKAHATASREMEREPGFVTFDVPGDGKFKVRNSPEGLAEFRKKVERSPGFSDKGGAKPAQPRTNGSTNEREGGDYFGVEKGSTDARMAVQNMVEEGDFQAALDYAAVKKVGMDSLKLSKEDRAKLDEWLKTKPATTAEGTAPMFSRGERTEPFYSALSREVDGINAKAQPAMGWLSQVQGLIKSGKVKADEVEWTGLNDWLKLQQGKVTKEQVTEFLKNNGVQVKDVTLEQGDAKFAVRPAPSRGGWEVRDPDGNWWGGYATEAEARAAGHNDVPERPPKYGQYTLPGGENYREVLLTLPDAHEQHHAAVNDRFLALKERVAARQGVEIRNLYDERDRGRLTDAEAEQLAELDKPNPNPAPYRSSHWDEGNVLAHIRLNDRTDADGKKVLFVEEIQSDWAQQGKKEGFDNDAKFNELVRQRDAAQDDSPQQEELQRQIDDMQRNSSKGVPRAPFVGKTDAWVSLAIKRIVKMAVDEGYDKVAFVNGAQSAERYDLSKQISRVEFQDNHTLGVGLADLEGPTTRGVVHAYDHDGLRVIAQSIQDAAKELPDLIGKDAAEKLLNAPAKSQRTEGGNHSRVRTLSGIDLKVGGEGMKAFYDKIVPSVAKDVIRKLGGEGMREINMGSLKEPTDAYKVQRAGDHYAVIDSRTGESLYARYTHEKAQEEAARLNGKVAETNGRYEGVQQQAFDITPAMREKAAGGVPLFRQGKPAEQKTGLTREQFSTEMSKAFGAKTAERLEKSGVVVPVDDQSSVPSHAVPFVRSGDTVFGLYDPKTDRTYAVLSNITPEMVKGLVIHEVGVHYGFENMLGKERYGQVIARIKAMGRMGNVEVKAALEQAKKNAAAPSQIPEETLAYLVQNHPDIGIIRTVISQIKAFLFNKFGIGGGALNADDITALAKAAVQHSSRTEPGARRPDFAAKDSVMADTNRRSFIVGTAAVLASGEGKADAKLGRATALAEKAANAPLSMEIAKVLRGNGATNPSGAKAIKQALQMIAQSGPEQLRALASRIADLMPERGVMLTVEKGDYNAHGAVEFSPIPHMRLFDGTVSHGLRYSTFMHESLHVAVLARYRSLSSGVLRSNDKVIGVAEPKAAPALEQFKNLWTEFREATRDLPKGAVSLEEARRTPDEFFVRALTDPELQATMSTLKYQGRTLFERFKDWVKTSLFGFGKSEGTEASWLDAALTASNDLLGSMKGDAADFNRASAIERVNSRTSSAPNEGGFADRVSFSRGPVALDRMSDTLDRIKSGVGNTGAAKNVSTAWDGVLMATAPQYRSDAAREMSRQLIEGMGEKEMRSIKFRTELNAAVREGDKATTLGAKGRDLLEKGLTVQADKAFLKNTHEENHAFMQAMDTGDAKYFDAHPDLKPMAEVIGKMFSEKAAAIQKLGTGALQAIRENYFPHIWKDEPKADAQQHIFSTLAKRPLEGKKSFTKERVFDDVQAGLDAGYEPISNNPLDIVALKMEEMDKYLLAHTVLKNMEGTNGVHLIAAGEKTPKGFTDVNGRFGSIERDGEKLRYVARDDVAQVINNYLSQSLYHNKYVGKPFTAYMGAANTLNQFQLGVFSAFHAGFTSMEAVISHASIGIKALTAGDLKGAAKYLSTAPAAWITNPKLGSKIVEAMTGTAAHPEVAPILEGLQMAGFKWQMDNRFRTDATKNMLQAWSEGRKFKAGLNSIPAMVEQTARPILEWLVPRQKFGVFGEMYSKWMQDNPNATHEELRNSAQQIWNRVDSRLGQVVYDRLFMHNVTKNFAQMLIRAPGWTGGTILEVGGGVKDLAGYAKSLASGKRPESISDRAAYTLSMLTVTALSNAILTGLFTGSAPDDWRDLVAFRTGNLDEKGRPERFMLPTYMKDVHSYLEAPGHTLIAKAHPLLSLVGDIGKNRDFYGTEIRSEDASLLTQLAQTAGFAAKAFVPFWVKGVQKEQEREGSALATVAPLIGVMPAPSDLNKSAAEKLISKYGADRAPQGSRTQEETDKSNLRRQMYVALRKGEQDKAKEAFDQGKVQGLFGPRDYLKVVRQARKDPLVSGFEHLTYEQAQRVMNVASDDEKRELAPLMLRKRIAFQRQHAGQGA